MGARPSSFKKKLLASSISSCLLASAGMAVAQAQQGDGPTVIEEVQVMGIRASLEQAMDIKRDSSGVVDAISAEDIGKFPDTNLAESLQRITGVAIDRSNGEGSQITVRGLGPSYNMITLNGRNMPGAVNDPAGEPNSRAFDFANLASESVSGVEVYKTTKPGISGGGLGATVNIKTTRPLDNPGLNVSVGAKAVHDTTNISGSDVTPEYSGLFSWSNDEDTFGAALTLSHQERESTNLRAYVVDWLPNVAIPATADLVNAPAAGELYYLPSDLRYSIEDQSRERTNGQLTVQYRPIERLTATVDYTYAENEVQRSRAEQSIWFAPGNITDITFTNHAIKTPAFYAETHGGGKDISFAQQDSHTVALNKSFGINLAYDVNDDFTVSLDYHNSSAANRPKNGEYSLANASIAAFVVDTQSVDYSSDLPIMEVTFDDSGPGNDNGYLDAGDMTTTRGTVHYAEQKTEIEQLKLDGIYDFDAFKVGAGVDIRKDSNHSVYGSNDPIMGDWGGANIDRVPDEFFFPRNYASVFEDDFGYAGDAFGLGLDADFHAITRWAATQAQIDTALGLADPTYSRQFYDFPGGKYTFGGKLNTDRLIEEDVNAAYIQVESQFEIAGMEAGVLAGVRYEETDLTSISNIQLPVDQVWEDNDDFNIILADEFTNYTAENSYNNVLPSIDFNISVTEDVVVRASWGRTMARPLYGELQAHTSIVKGDLANRLADRGNPLLEPLESDNVDLSVEWYYDDASYLSLGYFRKDVKNFIGSIQAQEAHYGLRDFRMGPRYQQAVADVVAAGGDPANTTLVFNQFLENEGLDPSDQSTSIGTDPTDPIQQWATTSPVNDRDSVIDGFEIAVQHIFGETGFGLQANYTMVDADVEFDVMSTATQFAIVGLSDTANVVAFYENEGLQARIAYNWREEFLSNRARGSAQAEFTEAYAQLDANVSYELTDQLTVFAEGINLTEENLRRHSRTEAMLWELDNLGARYQVGVRYAF